MHLNIRFHAQYKEYEEKAAKITNLVKCGRLANFEYYNMDQIIEKALNVAKDILER